MIKPLLYIALTGLLCSCTVTKTLYKDKEEKHYNPNAQTEENQESVKKEKHHTPATDAEEQEESKSSSKKHEKQTHQAPEPELPRMVFGDTESANVRIPSHLNNPFPSSGELVLPLDELSADFCYPYPGKVISPFGYRGRSMHSGIDIKAVPNDTIRATFSGVVRMSKVYSGYGNTIVIRHYNGIETLYSHNSRNLVSVNDVVKAGDAIALAGRTGRATTEHLHFEFRVANQAINPTLLLDTENKTLNPSTLYCYNRNGVVRASSRPASEVPIPLDEERLSTSEIASTAGSSAKTETSSNSSQKAQSSSSKSSSTSSSSGKVYHTIKSGDTLSGLARKYHTSVSKICQLNNIKSTKTLQLKERLRVK